MRDLKLYYKESCPFCKKVIQFMERNGIEVEMMDIKADPKNQEDLIKLGA